VIRNESFIRGMGDNYQEVRTMKPVSRIRITVFLFSCLALFLLFSGTRTSSAAEPIRIGIVFSITGPGGFIGTPQKDAVVAIVESVNKRGGLLGRQIELFIEDDKSVPTNAVIAVTKLARDRKVCAIVGPSMTDSGMAMIPTCEQEKVPFLLTAPVAAPYKKWVFYLGAGDSREGQWALDFTVKTFGAKRIAIVSSTDNHGATLATAVVNTVGKYPGASIAAHEKCEITDTSVIPQLMKIKAANPDALLVLMPGNVATVVAKNYKQLGMTAQVVTSHGVPMPDFVRNSGKIAEEYKWIMFGNFMGVVDKYPPDNPLKKNVYEPLRQIMLEKFGKDAKPNIFHAVTSDGIRAAIEAIKIAQSDDRAAIRDAIEKVRFEGFVGEFAPTPQDHQGAPTAATVPMVLKNGEFFPWQK
jgi:branched-chain amino acid transport system substrate-binding protein